MKAALWTLAAIASLALVTALYLLAQGRLGSELRRLSGWLEAHRTASPEPSSFTDTDAMARQLGSSGQSTSAPTAPPPPERRSR